MITLYLAGAIDLANGQSNWRTELMSVLEEKRVVGVAFDPSTAFKSARWGELDLHRSEFIEEMNRCALTKVDTFVACMLKAVPSVGVPIEMDMACQYDKHRYILTDIKPGTSVYLDNRFNVEHWIYIENATDPASVRSAIWKLGSRICDRDLHLLREEWNQNNP